MFLSFIVPVYNVEKYIPECLDSLLDQDIAHEEYEIICINDGSTDGSLEVLCHYAQMYSNIRIIDQKNSGVATARNAGLDAAQGEYIWFVDSDDFIRRNILAFLQKHSRETEADRVKIGVYVVNGDLTEAESSALEKGELNVNLRLYDSSSVNCILRRNFLQKYDLRFRYPALINEEDSIFMFEVNTSNPQCTELNIPIYIYRRRAGSATNATSAEANRRQLKSYLLAAQIMKQYYDHGTGNPRDAANLLMACIWRVMDGCTKLPGKERREMVRKMKALELYPFRRPAACTHVRSYQTSRTDLVGKIYDKIFLNMHRPWGFAAMIMLRKIIDIKHNLVK